MESRIERLCVEQGLKMTGQRRVIARVLSEAEDHPDVEELYRRAAVLDEKISIATVYRTVRLLEERGILERRDFGGGRARYEPTEHGRHYHLIDVDTGRVIEFEGMEHERLMQQIAAGLGFELVSTRLEIYGRRAAPAHAARHAGANGGTAALPDYGHAPEGLDPEEPDPKGPDPESGESESGASKSGAPRSMAHEKAAR